MDRSDRICVRQARSELALVDPSFLFCQGGVNRATTRRGAHIYQSTELHHRRETSRIRRLADFLWTEDPEDAAAM